MSSQTETEKDNSPELYSHNTWLDGSRRMTASQVIIPGTVILVDPGLICLPAALVPGPESEAYIRTRVQCLEDSEQQTFMDLPRYHEGRFGDYYSRYYTFAVTIKHSPEWSGIFPRICQARHSCSPNAVTSLIQCEDDPRKNWAFALRAAKKIFKGEEITRFYLDGGGMREERQRQYRDLFGSECTCDICNMTGDALRQSDDRRRLLTLGYLHMTRHGALEPQFAFDSLRRIQMACVGERIWDHSLWFLYGQACIYALRHGMPRAAYACGLLVKCVDRATVGPENPLHVRDRLLQFWAEEVAPLVTVEDQVFTRWKYTQNGPDGISTLLSLGQGFPSPEFMNFFNDFLDDRKFPLYKQLPFSGNNCTEQHAGEASSNQQPPDDYYNEDGSPKRLWCLLASLVMIDEKTGRWLLKDKSQQMFVANMSYYVGPGDVVPIPGRSTIAFLYPSRQTLPRDNKDGIITDPFSDVRVRPLLIQSPPMRPHPPVPC